MVAHPYLLAGGLRALSVINVILWPLSSGVMVAIAVRYTNFGMTDDIVTDEITLLDYVFAGMWAGILYGVAGLFGMCGSYERNRCKLCTALFFSLLALGAAGAAGSISGIVGFHVLDDQTTVCNLTNLTYVEPDLLDAAETDCLVWAILEIVLMGLSCLAALSNLLIALITLIGLCGPKENDYSLQHN